MGEPEVERNQGNFFVPKEVMELLGGEVIYPRFRRRKASENG